MAAVLFCAKSAVVQAVFVHGARIAAWTAFVYVAMQVQIIIGSEDAGKCAVYNGVIPYVLQLWYGGEEVVTRISAAVFFKGFVDAFIDFFVKSLREVGVEDQVSIADELLHLLVGQ